METGYAMFIYQCTRYIFIEVKMCSFSNILYDDCIIVYNYNLNIDEAHEFMVIIHIDGYRYITSLGGCTCPICHKAFLGRNFRQDYVRHYQSVHLKLRQYPCEVCGKMFSLPQTRRRHMRSKICTGWFVIFNCTFTITILGYWNVFSFKECFYGTFLCFRSESVLSI